MGSLIDLPPRDEEGRLLVVVESPRGASYKLAYVPEWRCFRLARPLPAGVRYPFDWGFVPGTRGPDGDPIDALLLTDEPLAPGVVVAARPLGVVRLSQKSKQGSGRQRNDRIIAAPADPRGAWRLEDVRALPDRLRRELEAFFVAAVFGEDKEPAIEGWGGPDEAERLVERNRVARHGSRKEAGGTAPRGGQGGSMNAITMLKQQHREVEDLFEQIQDADGSEKQELFDRIADALAIHALIEERHFYPEVRERDTEDLVDESYEEHREMKRVLADLLRMDIEDARFDDRLDELQQEVERHVEQEEDDLFPKVEKILDTDLQEAIAQAMLSTTADLEGTEPRNEVLNEMTAGAPPPY